MVQAGNDTRNVTFKERIGMTPSQAMFEEKPEKGVTDFRAFGCRPRLYEDKQHRPKGKHTPRAKKAMYVGFSHNMSACAFYIPDSGGQENQNVQSGQIF